MIVNALESTGRFHITNRPMVYTSNNKKAIIVSGEQIPVPTSTLSNLTSTGGVAGSTAAVQSSIDYMQVALQLEVVPLINSDREVNLDILQKLDSPSGATTNIGGSNVPDHQHPLYPHECLRARTRRPSCSAASLPRRSAGATRRFRSWGASR